MKYKAVIFDFDDTLVESRLLKWAQHKHVGKKFYNLDFTDDQIRQLYGKPFNDLIKELYGEVDTLENLHEAIQSVRDDFLKKVYPGVLELMKHLLGNKTEVGIVSATNKRYLVEDLERIGFPHDKFFIIQAADEVLHHKPDPKVFSIALEKLEEKGIKKEEIVYIGDALQDLKAAQGAGIGFIAVTTGLYSKEEFEQAGAKVVLSDIRELPEFI